MTARAIHRLIQFPGLAVGSFMEMLLSQRGLALGFLLVAALFTRGAWVRPPLSPDIRAMQLPLAVWPSPEGSAERMLVAPRNYHADSVGTVLLAVIEIGVVIMVFRPRWLKFFAGVLLVVSIMGVAVATLNHPELVELMDSELVQRRQIAGILRERSEMAMAANSPVRTQGLVLPRTDNSMVVQAIPPDTLFRGWYYHMYGPWLVFLSAFLVLLGSRGRWDRRLAHLGLWTMAGLLVSGAICSRRLRAEYHWNQAEELERVGDLDGSRRALDEAVSIFPEFKRLQRTWTLAGRMDYRVQRPSPYATFFRVSQLVYRQDRWLAIGMFKELTGNQDEFSLPPAVRNLGAQLFSDMARKYLADGSIVSARDAFIRACRLAPYRMDCVFGYGVVLAQNDRWNPELVETQFKSLIVRVGDRSLKADLLERLGNAFFEAGQLVEARKYYQESIDVFCQPKYVNIPAQEGMVGM